MPPKGTEDWIIWAAWADRITFEEILRCAVKLNPKLSKLCEEHLNLHSFRKWRARASQVSLKHQKRFKTLRKDY